MSKKPVSSKPAFDRASSKPARKSMSPKPAGTSGPKPPRDAKLAMDRKQFAREQAAAKPKVSAPSPAPGGSVSNPGRNLRSSLSKNDTKINQFVAKNHAQAKARQASKSPSSSKPAFSTASKQGQAKTAFSSAAKKTSAKTAFSSASRGGGKGGKSR